MKYELIVHSKNDEDSFYIENLTISLDGGAVYFTLSQGCEADFNAFIDAEIGYATGTIGKNDMWSCKIKGNGIQIKLENCYPTINDDGIIALRYAQKLFS